MKIQKLIIQDFKGIKSLEIYPTTRTIIYGDNATGKTTIYDAYLWLLFDKDSQNRKDFEIKPIENGEIKHNVETSVEAVFTIDGKDYLFKKVFKEKWIKKRGEAKATFTGHTTEYYINNVPKKKKEYDEAINQIAREDVFKVLSNVLYFNEQLNWKQRRELLFEISGVGENDSDLAQRLGFTDLAESFEKINVDDYKKSLLASRKKLNDDLKSIPTRIDELQKQIEETEDIKQLEQQLKELQKQQEQLKTTPKENPFTQKINQLNNEQIEALTLQIRDIQERIARVKAQENIQKRIIALQQDEKALSLQFAELEDELNKVETFIRKKVEIIEETIASKFTIARFKLFNEQINGGLEDTCETIVDGIPYRNLNNATRINVGLDIIKTLQKYYSKQLPIFIDNAEAVNELINMKGAQIIRLVVSKDKELRIE